MRGRPVLTSLQRPGPRRSGPGREERTPAQDRDPPTVHPPARLTTRVRTVPPGEGIAERPERRPARNGARPLVAARTFIDRAGPTRDRAKQAWRACRRD